MMLVKSINVYQLLSILFVLLFYSSLQASDDSHWGYSGNKGPEYWAELSPEYKICGTGVNQSPVDINNTLKATMDELVFDYRGGSTTIINNGHTLQINAAPGNFLRVGDDVFQLKQLHFHSPAEHQINGEKYLLEAHYVHEKENGELAVVAVLFREGEFNTTLKKIGKSAPREVDKIMPMDFDFAEAKLKTMSNSYYRYNGSLTTPPCTEGIRWFVLKTVSTISPDQTDKYVDLIGKDSRFLQPINARIILEN